MTGQTLNQYAVREKIGSGGMGEVYRAWDTRLERDVALKLLPTGSLANEAARRSFRREALSLSRLNHPNIATVHDFHSYEGVDYLVMELIQGQTLDARIRGGSLPESVVAEIGLQITSALEEAHEHSVIHRDLKPANVMITPKGQVKILDFGIAQLLRQSDENTTATASQHLGAGTLPYMSPEQLRGEPLDPRSDLYSVGVTLYEMATGVRPFHYGTKAAVAADILNRPPRRPSELNPQVSPALSAIILKCLEKVPAARYQAARELHHELRRLGTVTHTSTATPTTASRRPIVGSLVALPAKVFAGEADAFLADAIPSFLSTYLNQVANLETKVPPSSADVERMQGDLGKIAEAYNVHSLVLSLVTAQKRKLTLNVQLVEARTRRMLWSNEYHGTRARYHQLLRDAADGIRQAACPGAGTLPTARTVSQVEVDLLLHRGLYHSSLFVNRSRKEDLDAAAAAFERILETAPRRADVAGELARLHLARFGSAPPEEFVPAARKWALAALDADPRCARGWSVLSSLETADYRRKLECALKGAAFGDRDAFCQVELSLAIARSSFVLSLEASRHASSIDPLVVRGPISESLLTAGLGRRAEALECIERAMRIEPDNPMALFAKSQILVMNQQPAEAAALLPALEGHAASGRLRPEWLTYHRDLLAYLDGSQEAAVRLEAAGSGHTPFPRWEVATSGFAGLLARAGDIEAAVRVLVARNRMGIVPTYDHLLYNPDFAPLRADPRFELLAAPARTGFEIMVGILQQARMVGEFPAYLAQPLAEILQRVSFESS